MKFTTLATLAAIPCLFAVVQAECGGNKIDNSKVQALVKYNGAFDRLSNTTPVNGVMTACVCYKSDRLSCWGDMCVSCENSNYSDADFIKYCRESIALIKPDVGVGSSAWCNYPGLKGLKLVKYW
ncbi:hypothetical protein CPC16_008996 [Podila verticillata]|nr:hypothetical protein BGZ59_000125 [Podila verticillata]KAF9383255.1 hypothetical protein CPC16_008996 [Podila verticillata]KAI9236095.1 MAG: hypothetical protein BYD32DRAFT_419525 [Podila humilis]KFH70323.1 hypothetical protein MVEG_03174 [Podila verticillata NRRL 6337]